MQGKMAERENLRSSGHKMTFNGIVEFQIVQIKNKQCGFHVGDPVVTLSFWQTKAEKPRYEIGIR
jgi:hypothetical protein